MKSRTVKRRQYAKAKRVVAKVKKSRAKKNMDTFFLKARVNGMCVPAQGITVANYISSFWKLLDQNSAVGVYNNAEFRLFCSLYDRVRVNSITIKWTPKANVMSAFDAQDQSIKTNNGDGLVHTVVLRDDDGFQQNIARLSRTGGYKPFSILKKWQRSYGITYPKGVWLDCQNIFSDSTLIERLGGFGGIGIYGENYMEDSNEVFNQPIAAVELTYNCVFEGKIMTNLGFDGDDITVSKPVPTPYTPTDLVALQGTTEYDGRFDTGGAVVPVDDGGEAP